MADNFSRGLLRMSLAQICQNLGWNAVQTSPMEILTDVLERYLVEIGKYAHRYSEQFGRTEPNLDDLGLAFHEMGVDTRELTDYIKHVEPLPFVLDVPRYPVKKPHHLNFPKPNGRELAEREEHVPDHLPSMHPGWDDKVSSSSHAGLDEQHSTEMHAEVITGEKRPLNNSIDEGSPSKRLRILPEEAAPSSYEMKGVTMSHTGSIVGEGKLPDSKCPPPPTPTTPMPMKPSLFKTPSNASSVSDSYLGLQSPLLDSQSDYHSAEMAVSSTDYDDMSTSGLKSTPDFRTKSPRGRKHKYHIKQFIKTPKPWSPIRSPGRPRGRPPGSFRSPTSIHLKTGRSPGRPPKSATMTSASPSNPLSPGGSGLSPNSPMPKSPGRSPGRPPGKSPGRPPSSPGRGRPPKSPGQVGPGRPPKSPGQVGPGRPPKSPGQLGPGRPPKSPGYVGPGRPPKSPGQVGPGRPPKSPGVHGIGKPKSKSPGRPPGSPIRPPGRPPKSPGSGLLVRTPKSPGFPGRPAKSPGRPPLKKSPGRPPKSPGRGRPRKDSLTPQSSSSLHDFLLTGEPPIGEKVPTKAQLKSPPAGPFSQPFLSSTMAPYEFGSPTGVKTETVSEVTTTIDKNLAPYLSDDTNLQYQQYQQSSSKEATDTKPVVKHKGRGRPVGSIGKKKRQELEQQQLIFAKQLSLQSHEEELKHFKDDFESDKDEKEKEAGRLTPDWIKQREEEIQKELKEKEEEKETEVQVQKQTSAKDMPKGEEVQAKTEKEKDVPPKEPEPYIDLDEPPRLSPIVPLPIETVTSTKPTAATSDTNTAKHKEKDKDKGEKSSKKEKKKEKKKDKDKERHGKSTLLLLESEFENEKESMRNEKKKKKEKKLLKKIFLEKLMDSSPGSSPDVKDSKAEKTTAEGTPNKEPSVSKFEFPTLSDTPKPQKEPTIQPMRIAFGAGKEKTEFTIKKIPEDSDKSDKEHKKKKKKKDKDRERDKEEKRDRSSKEKEKKKKDKKEKKEEKDSKDSKASKEVPKLTFTIGGGSYSVKESKTEASKSSSDRAVTPQRVVSSRERSLSPVKSPRPGKSLSPLRISPVRFTPSPDSPSVPKTPSIGIGSPYASRSPSPTRRGRGISLDDYKSPLDSPVTRTASSSPPPTPTPASRSRSRSSRSRSRSLSPPPAKPSKAPPKEDLPPPPPPSSAVASVSAATVSTSGGTGAKGGKKASGAVFAETQGTIILKLPMGLKRILKMKRNEDGQIIWICPGCKLPDDGSPMIGCDVCDDWYHWPCVNITEEPPEDEPWYCPKHEPGSAKTPPKKSVASTPAKRGRGRGRGRKKKM